MGKTASQAGHECMSGSSEMILRSDHTLEEEPEDRERLDRLSSLSTMFSLISSNFRLSDVESEMRWGDCSRHRSIRFILPDSVSVWDSGTSISPCGISEEQYDEQVTSSSSSSSSCSSSKNDDDVEEV